MALGIHQPVYDWASHWRLLSRRKTDRKYTDGCFHPGIICHSFDGLAGAPTIYIPFLFEQKEPLVLQALRNAAVFIRRNLILVLVLGLLLALSFLAGTLAFMLTFVFGGAFVAFASNHAVLQDLGSD